LWSVPRLSLSYGVLVLFATGLLAAPAAHAATVTLGEANPAADPGGDCGLCTAIQTSTAATSPSYTVPQGVHPWVLTSFSTREDVTPTVNFRLLLAEHAGGANYTLRFRSQGQPTVANTLNTYILRIPVLPGWVLGLDTGSNTSMGRNGSLGDVFHIYGNTTVGTTAATGMPFAGSLLNVQATIESDCDADGLGDDTQDQDVASCQASGGPDTAIDKKPKRKTKKRRAKFKFSSPTPGATFECSLDGRPFAACSSPLKLRVKRGKHTFDVRALAAGEADGSPAEARWKVKRKRKRK
jgi:hypothetical protein